MITGKPNYYEKPYDENGRPKAHRCIYFPETVVTGNISTFAHYHKYIELLYVYSGSLSLVVDDEAPYTVSAGQMVIINSNESHQLNSLTRTREYVCLQFDPEILYAEDPSMAGLSEFLQTMFSKNRNHARVIDKASLDASPIPQLILSIREEWQERSTGADIIMRAAFIGIFGWVYRIWGSSEKNNDEMISAGGFIDKVRYYVKMHYATTTEADVAKECNYSLGYFSRRFNKSFGMSFREYLTRVRVKQAVKLLITNDLSITACSTYVGFSSTSYFIKKFKEIYGMSPKKYIAEQTNNNDQ